MNSSLQLLRADDRVTNTAPSERHLSATTATLHYAKTRHCL